MSLTAYHPMGEQQAQLSGVGTQNSFQNSVVRSVGRQAFRCTCTTTQTGGTANGLFSSATLHTTLGMGDCFCTFYFRVVSLPGANSEPIFQFLSGTTTLKLELRITSGGLLAVYDKDVALVATGATALSTNTWYRICVRGGNGTTAAYAVYVAAETADFGAAELSGTCNQLANNVDRCRVGRSANRNSQAVDFIYQDMVIDSANPWNNYNICIGIPTGNGSNTAFTGDFNDVIQYPNDGDTTFVSTTSSGVVETFAMTDRADMGANTSDTIHCFGSVCIAKGVALNENFSVTVVSGGTTSHSTNGNVGSTTYEARGYFHTVDPNTSAAWTWSAVDAAECGGRSGSTNEIRVSSVQSWILFTPVTEITGSLSKTLDDATLDADSDLQIQATLAKTLDDATVDADADLAIAASLSQTLGALTSTGSATLSLSGGLNATLGELSSQSNGELDIEGSTGGQLDDCSCGSSAELDIEGSCGAQLGDATLVATGTLGQSASLDQTLDDLTCAAAAELKIEGSLSKTLDDCVLSASGAMAPVILPTATDCWRKVFKDDNWTVPAGYDQDNWKKMFKDSNWSLQ